MNKKFIFKFKRDDGMSLTSVYDEYAIDKCVFGDMKGKQSNIFDFLTESSVDNMNDLMDDSYDRVDIDYLPTRWSTIDGNEEEASLFLYTFLKRMGRNPEKVEEYDGSYSSKISLWDMKMFF